MSNWGALSRMRAQFFPHATGPTDRWADPLRRGPVPPIVAARPALIMCGVMAIVGLGGGLILRRPEFVAFGAPALSLVLVGLAVLRRPVVHVELTASTNRAIVGDQVTMAATVRGPRGTRCSIATRLPSGIEVVADDASALLTLPESEICTHTFTVMGSEAGRAEIGPVVVRIDDGLGLVRSEQIATPLTMVRFVPGPQVMSTLLRAIRKGAHIGEQISNRRGEGFEFADLRPYVHGDAVRRVNWRASARHDEPLVVERRPDRNQDVMVVIDGHAEVRSTAGRSTLQRSMEAAAAVAGAHLGARDRVSFVGFGSTMTSVSPGSGHVHEYRLLDAIVTVATDNVGLGRVVSSLPMSARPGRSLVVVITPLLDKRSHNVVADLRARRYDVAVIVISPFSFAEDLVVGPNSDIAVGLWRLDHEQARDRLTALGCAVVLWDDATPIEFVLREVNAWRRRSRAGRSATV